MSQWLVAIAAACGLLFSSVASAYQVEIFFNARAPISGQPASRMTVTNNGAVGVGAINLLVTGPNTLTLNPAITSLSPPDSTLSINPLGDGQNFLQLNNVWSGASIVNAGAHDVWLADLSGPSLLTFAQGSEFALGSYTVYDAFLRPIPSVGIYADYFDYGVVYSYEAAEPATTSLLALGLAAIGLARRALR